MEVPTTPATERMQAHMIRIQPRHITLLVGVAAMLAALCDPWETITAWYYPGQYSQMDWSPIEFLWNFVASRFTGASVVIAWATSGMTPFAIVFALYLVCALFIAGHTPGLLGGHALSPSRAIALLMADACAGFLTLLGWFFLPYVYLWNDGGPSIHPTDGPISDGILPIGSVLSFFGIALVCIALFRIAALARQADG